MLRNPRKLTKLMMNSIAFIQQTNLPFLYMSQVPRAASSYRSLAKKSHNRSKLVSVPDTKGKTKMTDSIDRSKARVASCLVI